MELKMYWWIGEDNAGEMVDGTVMAENETHAWMVARAEAQESDTIILHVYDSDPLGEE